MREAENSLPRLKTDYIDLYQVHRPSATTDVEETGVTSAIIDPQTMEQLESQLPSVGVTLDTEILDRVNELVAPGVTLNPDDNSYGAAELTPQGRRR
jgi:aryl-alcohol dehydrogenase-like predicted oxidoreductase